MVAAPLYGLRSARSYIRLVNDNSLHLVRSRVGHAYSIRSGRYQVFRETHSGKAGGTPNVLVVGFRLKFIRSSRPLHWLFQRLSIITTPFWSGLRGFRTKLWLVETSRHDYVGIYDWRGRKSAKKYLELLLPVLRIFSVRGSVWTETHEGRELNDFLADIKA